ncbi:lipoprotein [alpha proteobacterium U9-1i]|nr:lipoprotein [alpha proteobacterium U9-1i]
MAAGALALAGCAPTPSPDATGEPALWRITDADSEIWLFGSVHVLPPALDWRGPRFEAAFAAAEELVTETDVGASDYAALVSRYGRLPDGAPDLGARLSDAERSQLGRVAQTLRIAPESFNRDRPWFAAVRLSFAYAIAQGHAPEAGVENVLVPQARAAGKRISFLETTEQQIRTLADLPADDELRFLTVTLRQIEHEAESLDATDALWVRGDVAELGRQLDAQMAEAGPEVMDAIITRRNEAWTIEIERRLAGSGRIFYAVGAAHLAGAHSVVAMLRARGVTVEGP